MEDLARWMLKVKVASVGHRRDAVKLGSAFDEWSWQSLAARQIGAILTCHTGWLELLILDCDFRWWQVAGARHHLRPHSGDADSLLLLQCRSASKKLL